MSRVGNPVRRHNFVPPLHWIKKGSCKLLVKVCARSNDNLFGGQSLPRNSVGRLTDRPDMTIAAYRDAKQQRNNNLSRYFNL